MDPKLYNAAMNGDLIYLQTFQETSNLQSQQTPCQDTVLHVAAEFYQIEFARTAVRDCPSLLWQVNSSGDTALHIAAREDFSESVEMVKFFIQCARRADAEAGESRQLRELLRMVNFEKDTALHCASRIGCPKSIELLAEADPEVCSFVNDANESPLYLCAASGYLNIPEIIINCAPSSASHKGPNGLTPLHLTLYFPDYALDEVEYLLRWRVEMIKEGDNLGLTSLHYAALYGNSKVTKLLLQYDRSAVYLLDSNGKSALHLAAFRGSIDVFEHLLNCCPDCWKLVDNKGRTALHAAVLGNQRAVVQFILKTPWLSRLINKRDKDGNTPFHLAALYKLYVMIQILAKDEKPSVKIANKEFSTAFEVYDEHKEEGLRAEIARFDLKRFHSPLSMQRFADKELKSMDKEPSTAKEETSTNNPNKEGNSSDFGQQSALEVNLLVATLVATVTFAAGFTMPGGFISNGQDEGLATLTNKSAAFEVFVVFNTLAFCCSVFAVLLQFHSSLTNYHLRVRYMGIAAISTTLAILAMVLAFSCGTYVVLTKSIRLSLTPYIICACFVLLYFSVPLADPAVSGFPCLDRLQSFVRDMIIRYARFE